jgi:hypothetical protein
MIVTTVSFDEPTFELLRHRADEESTNVRELVRRAVERFAQGTEARPAA